MEQVLSQLAMKRVKKYIKYVDINEQDEQMLAWLEAESCYLHLSWFKELGLWCC